MKAKIGTSFGLALLLAVGIIATMLALGMFSLSAVNANPGPITIPVVGGSGSTAGNAINMTNVPTTPGEVAAYTLSFQNPTELVVGSGQIYVKFDANIGVPSSIEKERITISASGGGVSNPQLDPQITSDNSGNPVIIFTIGDTDPGTAASDNLAAWNTTAKDAGGPTNTNSGHVLQFSSLAGLTNSVVPDTESSTWVSMSDDGTNYGTARAFTVLRWLELSSTGDVAGTVITLTGKAFSSGGTANIWLDPNYDGIKDSTESDITTSDANITGGEFTASVTISSSFLVGPNSINARDGLGIAPSLNVLATPRLGAQVFTKIGAISVSVASASRGETVTITLDDFGGSATADGNVTAVTFGGAGASLAVALAAGTADYTDTDGSFTVAVPATASLGTQTVTVTSVDTSGDTTEAARSANITIIGGFAITASPTTAVANQTITVSGSGFIESGTVTANTITVSGVAATHAVIDIDSSGNMITTFALPADTTDTGGALRVAGDHEILVLDSANRIGIATVTVPAKAITLDTSTSRRDSTVGITGTGFSASTVVTITHGSTTVATVTADSAGNLPAGTTFTVPSGALIPSTNTVTAAIGAPTTGLNRTATATHYVPGATITITPDSAASGDYVTIAGLDFPGYVSLSILDIGGVSALPTPAPATESDGSFTASIRIPALGTGTQTVQITAGNTTANLPVTVLAATVVAVVTTDATEDTFAEEITADNLVRVWSYSNETQDWSFFDPRPAFSAANTYTSTTTSDIVWVNVIAESTFQGQTLYLGWNLISLN